MQERADGRNVTVELLQWSYVVRILGTHPT